jgi:hypothetical protein
MKPLLSIVRVVGVPVLIMLGLVVYSSVELAFDKNSVSVQTRAPRTH